MIITHDYENTTLHVGIDGRLDSTTSAQLESLLKEQLHSQVEKLVLDFAKLSYMSSAGIRVLMSAEKVMSRQGEMVLTNVNEEIMEIFEMTALVDFLNFQ